MANKGIMVAQRDWVIVEKFEPDSTTESGIVVSSSEDPDLGTVLSVGPECEGSGLSEGTVVAPDWSKAILIRHLTCAIRLTDVVAIVRPSLN